MFFFFFFHLAFRSSRCWFSHKGSSFSLHTVPPAQVAKELRADLIYNVSQTGGHLGSR